LTYRTGRRPAARLLPWVEDGRADTCELIADGPPTDCSGGQVRRPPGPASIRRMTREALLIAKSPCCAQPLGPAPVAVAPPAAALLPASFALPFRAHPGCCAARGRRRGADVMSLALMRRAIASPEIPVPRHLKESEL
jgi:hypothetical protein